MKNVLRKQEKVSPLYDDVTVYCGLSDALWVL